MYPLQILAALVLCAGQGVLIVALLLEQRRRRAAQRSLKAALSDARSSEALSQALLATLDAQMAILDRSGLLLQANHAWLHPEHATSGDLCCLGGGGGQYRAACREAAASGSAAAGELLRGLETTLAGSRERFRTEYRCGAGPSERWLELVVEPLARPEGGVVLTQVDIKARKPVEADLARQLQEIAHASRAAVLGELAASLAHELRQPLSAIRSNAEAARLYLAAQPPDLEELSAILSDIERDDERAAQVITRLRSLFRKADGQSELADLNDLVQGVLRLVHSDAVVRGVRISEELSAELPRVSGDAVQIQQVILNLTINGMEAMASNERDDRRLRVETRAHDEKWVELVIQDAGPGIDPEALESIFDPFYTTKAGGLGIGLSVSRMIVSEHGGLVWGENGPHGAVFHVTLPAAGEKEEKCAVGIGCSW
jgi:C4-dicarboxylate-specific signal transduction histidine kinase